MARNVYPTKVDRYTRSIDITLERLAIEIGISPATLLKVRALNGDRDRGKIHWTTLVLIAVHMRIIKSGETVTPDDPRLRQLAPSRLRTTRGRGAPRYWYHY